MNDEVTNNNGTQPPAPAQPPRAELPPVSPEGVAMLMQMLDMDENLKVSLAVLLAWDAKHPGSAPPSSQGQADKRRDYFLTLDDEAQEQYALLGRDLARLVCGSISRFIQPAQPAEQGSGLWTPGKGDPGLVDSQGLKEPPL